MSHSQTIDPHPLDLAEPVPDAVRQRQPQPTGERIFIAEMDGITHELFMDFEFPRTDRFRKLLLAELDWLEKLVSHAPSVGAHYENLLRDLLAEYLSSSLKVGTGFVFNSALMQSSPQTDIIVYSDKARSPLYRRGEFLIVDSLSTISVCEVKKNLNITNLRDTIKKTLHVNYGKERAKSPGISNLIIFAFESRLNYERISDVVCSTIEEFLKKRTGQTQNGIPVTFGIEQITLPKIFIFRRKEYIETRIVPEPNNRSGEVIEVAILSAGAEDCLGAFLTAMNPDELTAIGERNLVTSNIVNFVSSLRVPTPPNRITRLSTQQLLDRFPDARELLKYKPGEPRKYGAIVPSGALAAIMHSFDGFGTTVVAVG